MDQVLRAYLLFVLPVILSPQTYQPFPPEETLQARFGDQRPGCACGIGKNHGRDSHFDAMLVAPSSVQTAPNTPISITYDASGICWGQSIRQVSGRHGTVIWGPGTIQDLPDTFGIVTVPGYSQPTTQQIQIEVKVDCYDDGSAHCSNRCSASATVPVVVR